MPRAIFLDRDGVINKLIFNHFNNEFEPPHKAEDLNLYPWTLESLKLALDNDFKLFLVSNQPDYAKGKCSLDDLKIVHKRLNEILFENHITFTEYYYCYHHPAGKVDEYSGECDCRKPKPYFLQKAKEKYNINMDESWMIGDRETDVICGKKAGVRTILVKSEEQKEVSGKQNSVSDFNAENLLEGIKLIINH